MKKFLFLLLASVIMMTACTYERQIGCQTFTVKKVKGAEKFAFPKSQIFYDEVTFLNDKEHPLYIGRIENDKWAISVNGQRVTEEPLLSWKKLGYNCYENYLQTDRVYHTFTTSKGVYLGYVEWFAGTKGGPYEDVFMSNHGSYLYKENGKWGFSNEYIYPQYDALFRVFEVTPSGKRSTFFIYRKGSIWGAVDNKNKPITISQRKIKEYLNIPINPSGKLKAFTATEIARDRIGNKEVGQIDVQDGWASHWQ